MKRTGIVNASPLIVLARIGQIDLLTGVCPKLVVPSGVAHEILRGDHSDPARQWIAHEGREFVKQVRKINDLVAGWDLGLGESHVVTYALAHARTEAILDDAAARTCAKALGVEVCGTLGLLLRAKRMGLVHEIRPILTHLVHNGFHVGQVLVKVALEIANES